MDKIKKVYTDSRYKTSDSVSNSDFKFELKEALDLPENAVCYVDDISIPHSWYSVEDNNNKLYIGLTRADLTKSYNVLTIAPGSYTGASLASVIQIVLRLRFLREGFGCICNSSKGTVTISANKLFNIYIDLDVIVAAILGVG